MRKVIQISATSDTDNGQEIIALCNDGTLWSGIWIYHGRENPQTVKWRRINDVPQPEPEEES